MINEVHNMSLESIENTYRRRMLNSAQKKETSERDL